MLLWILLNCLTNRSTKCEKIIAFVLRLIHHAVDVNAILLICNGNTNAAFPWNAGLIVVVWSAQLLQLHFSVPGHLYIRVGCNHNWCAWRHCCIASYVKSVFWSHILLPQRILRAIFSFSVEKGKVRFWFSNRWFKSMSEKHLKSCENCDLLSWSSKHCIQQSNFQRRAWQVKYFNYDFVSIFSVLLCLTHEYQSYAIKTDVTIDLCPGHENSCGHRVTFFQLIPGNHLPIYRAWVSMSLPLFIMRSVFYPMMSHVQPACMLLKQQIHRFLFSGVETLCEPLEYVRKHVRPEPWEPSRELDDLPWCSQHPQEWSTVLTSSSGSYLYFLYVK